VKLIAKGDQKKELMLEKWRPIRPGKALQDRMKY
jgi:hypothetical protein